MRPFYNVDKYRQTYHGIVGNNDAGRFLIPNESQTKFFHVVATNTLGWEHVSVSLRSGNDPKNIIERCPHWDELMDIRNLFFWKGETPMLIYPKDHDKGPNTPHVVHMWKKSNQNLSVPVQDGFTLDEKKEIEGSSKIYNIVINRDINWSRASIRLKSPSGVILDRFPTWPEICEAKNAIFDESQPAVVFMTPTSPDNYTIDMWYSHNDEIELPNVKIRSI